MYKKEQEWGFFSPVICEVVRMRLGCPRSGSSYTLTLYLRPGRRSLMVTEVVLRATSGGEQKISKQGYSVLHTVFMVLICCPLYSIIVNYYT